ncbi:MAG TPA: hypothetical protein VJN02_04525 [Gammaproteobacteria bacterium]|nr:hypothetical protein [Gammaproteobacteria bacterium]
MKKLSFIFALLFMCSHALANQVITLPKKFGTSMTQEWYITSPAEAMSIQTSVPINIILHPYMRDAAGAPLNGVNVICNGNSIHVNAGSFLTCQTSENTHWTNDGAMPTAWSFGQVTVGYPLKK